MSDKRTVSTDALETLGTIIDDTQKRDAIHLAVLPAVAGTRLYPGQVIDLKDGIAVPSISGLGIVDPFLVGAVLPEQRFWMVLRPRIIKSLRHVWSHPAFEDEAGTHAPPTETADKAAARAALEQIALECDSTVEQLLTGAVDYLDSGAYLSEGSRWDGTYLPDRFWSHFETITGRKVAEDDRGSFFSCSC